MTIDLRRQYPLINLLSTADRKAWLGSGKEISLAVGEILFREGTDGAWAYLLNSGRVRILRRAKYGGEMTVGVLDPVHLFGEYALVPPHKNTATCRAIDSTELLRLPLVRLRESLMAQPDIWRTIKRWLRLHSLVAYLRDRAFLGFMSAGTALDFADGLASFTYQPGQTIQADGLADDRWFFVDEGQVRLRDSDEEVVVGPGECFGEPGLLGRGGLALAMAASSVRCRSLARDTFLPPEIGAMPSQQTIFVQLRNSSGYPWIGQEGFADCGVAALAMLAAALGRPVAFSELRKVLRPVGGGLSMLELQAGAERIGLRPRTVRIGSNQLDHLSLPAIILLDVGHYVTLYEVNATGVVFGDPASGLTKWSRELLQASFSGFALLSREPPSGVMRE